MVLRITSDYTALHNTPPRRQIIAGRPRDEKPCEITHRSQLLAEAANEIASLRLTDAEREAVWGVATGMEKNGFPGYAAVIRILLERLRPTATDATQEGGRA